MDPYVYPGTTVLKNSRDIRDADQLDRFEADATASRLYELQKQPPIGSFDAKHLQKIHAYIFQDVYPWAGQIRTVELRRPGQSSYAFRQHIEPSLAKTMRHLKKEQDLKNLKPLQFAKRAAHYLGEINAIHPFREGNGRAQREFMRQLAERNGYTLDWSRTTREKMYEASYRSFQGGDNRGLEEVMHACLQQRSREAERTSEKSAAQPAAAYDPDKALDEALRKAATKKRERAQTQQRTKDKARDRDDERSR